MIAPLGADSGSLSAVPALSGPSRTPLFGRPAAIMVDFHGVLVDYRESDIAGWRWWAESHDLDPDAVLAGTATRMERLSRWAGNLDVAAEARRLTQYLTDHTDGVTAYEGALELLDGTTGIPVAVVTNSPFALVDARLRAAGLPTPKVLVTADSVAELKPSPAAYVHAANMLGVPIDQCHVLEDTPHGIAAGKAAGAFVVALATTSQAAQLPGHDAVVADIAEYLSLDPITRTVRSTSSN